MGDSIQHKRHILQINFENLSSVSSNANEQIEYETLDIVGLIRADTDATNNLSDLCLKFWETIGRTVTELTVDKIHFFPKVKPNILVPRLKPIIDRLVSLKKLKLTLETLEIFSSIFSMQNKDIEIIEICGNFDTRTCIFVISEETADRTEEVEGKNWAISPEFEKLIKYFTTSLKIISFTCSLPYRYASIIEPIKYFSQNCLGADELILDMGSVSPETNYCIWSMEIEVTEQNERSIKTAVVRAIDILFANDFVPFCIFEHNICMDKLVRHISMTFREACLLCLEYLIKSFPNTVRWTPHPKNLPLRSTTITLMSKRLPYYDNLSLQYNERLELLPDFTQLKYLDIRLEDDQTSDGLFHLCKCCPNLEDFTIVFSYADIFRTTIGKAIVNGIATHLKKLKILEIDERVKIDSLGLKAIRMNLKRLTMLSFSCDEDSEELLELFKELPHLECIEYVLNFARRRLTRHQSLIVLNAVDQKNSCDAIDILPEELWAQVFQNLHIKEQVICRRVCKQWLNVLNSFPLFRRLFRLRSCVLSMDTNPCKTFKNTHFNYNILLLEGPIVICDTDVNEFWCTLGRSINEIVFGAWMTVEIWLRLESGGMTIRNFPALKTITFRDAKIFFELLSNCHDTMGAMLKCLKILVIDSFSDDMKYEIGADIDMTNLECVRITGGCSWESLKLFAKWISKCPMLGTLDLNNYRSSKSEFPSEFVPIFRQLKHLKISGTLDANEMAFVSKNCKILETLTFQNLNSILTRNISYHDGSRHNYDISEEIGFRNMAIQLFESLNRLTTVSFLGHAKVTIKYQLETTCLSKNLVESKIAKYLLMKQMVHSFWSAK